ncbi:protein pal1 [Chaetomidium leptoderma]|uniref:Protein pal1 n=1 Tax=Chaetomidium leptoderma TaxID=669021 RepID=A0AAN6VV01_9PEZI|nr:protein pal1 [Chaetomidium leptoderma]
MGDRDYDDDYTVDKQWASKYILGPLHDPEPNQVCATRLKPLPTPPASANLTRGHFSQGHRTTIDDEEQPFLRRVLSRSNSAKAKPLPPSPPRSKYPPMSALERKRSVHTANPPPTRWNQGTILSRANSVSTPRPSADAMAAVGDDNGPRRRAGSLAERYPGDRSHRPLEMLAQEHRSREGGGDALPRRSASLRERYPGDMSHRPLAVLKREHRAADRAPHLHNHRRQQPSDTIDTLDISGPVPNATYHHSGPFDATLKARNTNKKYAPIEAVRDTNLEALKATPAEYVQDSLEKHVPLQGTAVVPPGMADMGGRTMHYEEGADLMREADAPGGAYKRWDHVRYRDDDLKGKGEPFFSHDQNARGKQQATTSHNGTTSVSYEMQPTTTSSRDYSSSNKRAQGVVVTHTRRHHHRSASNGGADMEEEGEGVPSSSSGLQRSHTTGKSLTQSLKRRFGSLRKKRPSEAAGY